MKAGHCKLEDQSCSVLANAFKKNKKIKLEEIDLNSNNISGKGFEVLFASLSTIKSVQIVNVSANITEEN